MFWNKCHLCASLRSNIASVVTTGVISRLIRRYCKQREWYEPMPHVLYSPELLSTTVAITVAQDVVKHRHHRAAQLPRYTSMLPCSSRTTLKIELMCERTTCNLRNHCRRRRETSLSVGNDDKCWSPSEQALTISIATYFRTPTFCWGRKTLSTSAIASDDENYPRKTATSPELCAAQWLRPTINVSHLWLLA